MPKRNHFDFLKFSSTNKPSTLGKLCFAKILLGISSLTKIITPHHGFCLASMAKNNKNIIFSAVQI